MCIAQTPANDPPHSQAVVHLKRALNDMQGSEQKQGTKGSTPDRRTYTKHLLKLHILHCQKQQNDKESSLFSGDQIGSPPQVRQEAHRAEAPNADRR